MKKNLLFCLAGLLLLSACNLGNKKPTNSEIIKKAAGMPGVNAGSGNFDIDAPSGWTRIDTSISGLKATLLMSSDASKGFRSNVNVITQAMQGMSDDSYFDANVVGLRSNLAQFQTIDKGQKQVNGMNARWIHYSGLNNGMMLEQMLYIIPSGGVAYLITCTSLQGQMAKDQSNFDVAVNSFKVH
ncbi:MAG TPA: PsbP-related protein [Puia sp.]|nr:PsbP-related protein [Puia sp.]